MDFDRITHGSEVMDGKACIRGLPVTVGMVVGQIGAGQSIDALLVDFPYLEREDVLQALRYAAQLAEDELPDNDDLAWAVESVEASRRDVGQGRGLTVEEHQARNAGRLAP